MQGNQSDWISGVELAVAILASIVFFRSSADLSPASGLIKLCLWLMLGLILLTIPSASLGVLLIPITVLFNDTGVPLDQLFVKAILPLMLTPAWIVVAALAVVHTIKGFSRARLAAALLITASLACFMAGNDYARVGIEMIRQVAPTHQ